MGASLDGLTDFGDVAAEINCAGQEDHQTAKEGRVPEKCIPQVQWQLMAGMVPF